MAEPAIVNALKAIEQQMRKQNDVLDKIHKALSAMNNNYVVVNRNPNDVVEPPDEFTGPAVPWSRPIEGEKPNQCPTGGCPGDVNYGAPGSGHIGTCTYPLPNG